MKKQTQEMQVINAIRSNGGYATLGNLYHMVDTSQWNTKTPNESIRRIVQMSKEIFRIQPGLWALEECKEHVLELFELKEKDPEKENRFTHSYYQGLLVEIGNMQHLTTFVPAQDKNHKFLEKTLEDLCSTITIPHFAREDFENRAKTVDVIWFNCRQMPHSFFEVEHSTDIQNSIVKYCDLQDFHSRFIIVAPEGRRAQFLKVMERTAFKDIRERVDFCNYDLISKQYDLMCKMALLQGII